MVKYIGKIPTEITTIFDELKSDRIEPLFEITNKNGKFKSFIKNNDEFIYYNDKGEYYESCKKEECISYKQIEIISVVKSFDIKHSDVNIFLLNSRNQENKTVECHEITFYNELGFKCEYWAEKAINNFNEYPDKEGFILIKNLNNEKENLRPIFVSGYSVRDLGLISERILLNPKEIIENDILVKQSKILEIFNFMEKLDIKINDDSSQLDLFELNHIRSRIEDSNLSKEDLSGSYSFIDLQKKYEKYLKKKK